MTVALTPIDLDRTTSVRIVKLPERFDVHSGVELPAASVRAGTTLLIDGSGVCFADLASLQSIVDTRLAMLDQGSDLAIGAPSDELRATLELTGFGDLVPVLAGGSL